MATFGDSTANIGIIQGSNAVPINAISVLGSDEVGIRELAVWALPIQFPMAQLIGNFGIDGHDTSAMLDANRVAPFTGQPMSIQDLIDCAPEVVVLRGGSINDLQGVNASTLNATVTSCVANHRQILTRMVNAGLKVLDCGIFGYGDGTLASSSTPSVVRSALLQVNSALSAMQVDFGSAVRFVSSLGTLHDSTGKFLPGMTIDGLHLSIAGGLAQAQLEANALTAWLGSGKGTVYAGTNLMTNANMASTGAPGVTPVGYSSASENATLSNQLVESIGGKTFFTVRSALPAGYSSTTIRLPFNLSGLATNEVIGCEFDFLCERQSGVAPSFAGVDARQEYVWGTNQVVHFAGSSARASSATNATLNGRIVFLPFRLPAMGTAFNASQSLLSLKLAFDCTGPSVVKMGVGNPRLVRV